MWLSRRRLGLEGLQQIENDTGKLPARPCEFTDNVSPPSPPASALSAPADTTVIVMALTQLADSIKLLALSNLASSEEQREECRKKIMAQ